MRELPALARSAADAPTPWMRTPESEGPATFAAPSPRVSLVFPSSSSLRVTSAGRDER